MARKNEPQPKYIQVTVRINEEKYSILDSYAKDLDVPLSTVIKIAINEWTTNKQKKKLLEDK